MRFGGHLSLSGEGCLSVLGDGATIVEPLAASACSPGFGMLTDRYGVTWTGTIQPATAI